MLTSAQALPMAAVALLAEGVDRNLDCSMGVIICVLSPSSRRAWIEIARPGLGFSAVAMSPSSRRAWIEISSLFPPLWGDCRPPRGGRG